MKQFDLKFSIGKLKHFSPKNLFPHTPGDIWFVVLILFTGLCMLIFILSVVLFFGINDVEESVEPEGSTDVKSINRVQLEELLGIIRERKETFEIGTRTVILQEQEDVETAPEDNDAFSQ